MSRSTPPSPAQRQFEGLVTAISRKLAGFRWAFMPLGLVALIAVGVHAAADVILCWPALGYRERDAGKPVVLETSLTGTGGFRQLVRRAVARPTTMRVFRPLAVGLVALAGGCAVARMVQGAVYLPTRGALGDGPAGFLGRATALLALASVLYALGWRAVLRTLQDADVMSEDGAPTKAEALWRGLPATVVVIPLAFAALAGATPLLSFFR